MKDEELEGGGRLSGENCYNHKGVVLFILLVAIEY